VLASRIVAWRKANGRFKTIEDLRQVSGVGDAKFADLRPLVRI
jgi:competence protein ComEA